jgi:CO/xanthine dehydrogenase Mo-binding subunit
VAGHAAAARRGAKELGLPALLELSGIGAALYEEFAYNEDGLLVAQTFMDYLLPSAHEVPRVEIVHHETPSPHTVFGQKGSGESGYLGSPAAISSAINDAIKPLGIAVNSLPIKVTALGDLIASAQSKANV